MEVFRQTWRRLKHAWAYFKWAYSNEFGGEFTTILRLLIFKFERDIAYYKTCSFLPTEDKEKIIQQIQRVVNKLKAVVETDFFNLYVEKRAIRELGFSLEIEHCRDSNDCFEVRIIYKDPRGNDPKYSFLVSLFYKNASEFEVKILKRLLRESFREINTNIMEWWD